MVPSFTPNLFAYTSHTALRIAPVLLLQSAVRPHPRRFFPHEYIVREVEPLRLESLFHRNGKTYSANSVRARSTTVLHPPSKDWMITVSSTLTHRWTVYAPSFIHLQLWSSGLDGISFCLRLGPSLSRSQELTADQLFNPAHITEISLEIAEDDWKKLCEQTRDPGKVFAGKIEDPFTYFKADITIDGTQIKSVGVRKKGFIGSLDDHFPSLKVNLMNMKTNSRSSTSMS